MIQFFVGMIVGAAVILFALAIWTVIEEEREEQRRRNK